MLDTLHDALMTFYGEALMHYPELMGDAELAAIEAALRGPSKPEQDADNNPAWRLMVFLSEYRDAAELSSYAALYEAHEALLAAAEQAGGEL